MHHPPEGSSAENGMVAPGPSPSLIHQETGYSIIPESPSSSKAIRAESMPDEAANFVEVYDGLPGKENNGSYEYGHAEESLKEPKTEMEGFIMRDNDIDVIQEPVAEIDSLKNGLPDGFKDLQSFMARDRDADVIAKESFAPQRRKVQWNDNNGKELFQVYEYEASDTGDSEDDEEEADAHVCACTIQ